MLIKSTMFGGTVKITPLGVVVIVTTMLVGLIFYAKTSSRKAATKPMDYEISLRQMLAVGIELCERAGEEIRKVHDNEAGVQKEIKGKTKEGANEYLTAADTRSHGVIVRGLETMFPGVKIISEEHSDIPEDLDAFPSDKFVPSVDLEELVDVKENINDLTVWVDPLDATQEFTENLLQYVTVLICIAFKDEPLIGIIHQPFEKKTVWGWSGVGSSKNIHVIKSLPSKQRKIIVSRSHAGDIKKVALKVFGNETEVISAGGAGYKTLQVIKGEANAYIHKTLIKKWDICAPNALLNALQGQMTTIKGNSINYKATAPPENKDGILATITNHKEYLNLVKEFIS